MSPKIVKNNSYTAVKLYCIQQLARKEKRTKSRQGKVFTRARPEVLLIALLIPCISFKSHWFTSILTSYRAFPVSIYRNGIPHFGRDNFLYIYRRTSERDQYIFSKGETKWIQDWRRNRAYNDSSDFIKWYFLRDIFHILITWVTCIQTLTKMVSL